MSTTTFRTLLAISFLTLAAIAVYANGPGNLDLTFNGTGYKFDGFGGGMDWGKDAVAQPDGKIVVAGFSYRSSEENSDVALARYNTDGTFDTSFGEGGKVVTTVRAAADQALSIALQLDGKIVVAGYVATTQNAGKDFLVVRYNANGTLDTSFGTVGKAITPITVGFSGSDDLAYDVAIQPDGKIVAAGTAGIYSAIVRYNSDGSLDGTFGSGGIITITPSTGIRIFSLAIQPDGKIVTAGATNGPGYGGYGGSFALLRYHSDGSPDTTFDGDGTVLTVIFESSVAYSLALQPDGKIVAGGHAVTGAVDGDYDFAIVRYNTDGSLDKGFDGDGKFTTSILGGDDAHSVAAQSDGKIVAAGRTGAPNQQQHFAAVRLNPDGTLDNTFGSGGKVVTDISGSTYYADLDWANSAVVLPTGKIIVAGTCRCGYDEFAVVRYNSDGSLDNGFDSDGKVISDVGNNYYYGTDVVVQPDGKIIASVYGMAGLAGFRLVRYNPDGTLDTSFGEGGKVKTYFFPVASAQEILLQPDGKILVAGYENEENNQRIAIVRYNTDGSLDTTFDGDGIAITAVFGGGPCSAHSMALGPDGKIVVTGSAYNWSEQTRYYLIARYNTDGSLDTSFDGDGIITTLAYAPYTIAVQSDGKIVIGGSVGGYHTEVFTLIRLNLNGTPDTGFDGDGVVSTPIMPSGWSAVTTIKIMPDGRILAGGYTTDSSNTADFVVARYNSNGSLDTSFDSDGKVITVVTPVNDYISEIAIQSDGRIVTGGTTENYPTGTRDLALVRYNPDGSLDGTYGTGGKALIDLGYTGDTITAMALDATGKAVITGGSYNFFTARITAENAPLVDVAGRLTDANGRGLSGVEVVLNRADGTWQYTLTNGFGYFIFNYVPSNEVYLVTISSKRYVFQPDSRSVTLINSAYDVDFLGGPRPETKNTPAAVEKPPRNRRVGR